MDLHKNDLGDLLDTIHPKTKMLLIRAAVFFALAAAFLIFLFDFRAFGSGIGFARAALPLFLPLAAIVFALTLVWSTGKRVALYEKGIVYHTAGFELVGGYATMKSVMITQECGRDRKQGVGDYTVATSLLPVTALTIIFEDGKRWAFFGGTFADLDTKGIFVQKCWTRMRNASAATAATDVTTAGG